MDTPVLIPPAEHEDVIAPAGRMIAFGVGADEFDDKYAAHFHERIQGIVIKMAPISEEHDKRNRVIAYLLETYLDFNPIFQLREAPFMLRNVEHDVDREPDLMVIRNANTAQLTPTMMKGVPDIVVEIVSKESIGRDYGDKLIEYERLGVPEYWIFDPLRQRATFYRMSEGGRYDIVIPDNGVYTTPILPKLLLRTDDLFRTPPPGAREIFHAVEAMFTE